MGNIVGIDLGTTNSVAAFKFAEVEVVTADDNQSPDRKLTRSVVATTPNGIVVGETAYNQLKADPENAIVSIKRLIGRGFSDPVVQAQLARLNYKITQSTKGTDNSLSVWLGGKEYAPEDISAEILKKVVHNAQIYQSQKGQKSTIDRAVITVPAYFSDKQRYTTQTAAKRAGLSEPELLPEPTAAAISYGFKPNADDVKTILVYDFGGGTFDSALITAAGTQFIESGKAGDLWLGGDDIDDRIIELVKQQVAAGLTEKVGTVSRDYFIELADCSHYKIVKQGDILPVSNSYTFKTEADGQSLIHFKFFNTDLVNQQNEKIGEMWLALDRPYPEQTEVAITVELDEKNSSLQITAALKNNPKIVVSSSFSYGGEDEKIAQKVEQIIKDLNDEGRLTDRGVREAYRIAGETVHATNQIRDRDGQIADDRRQLAQQKLKELEKLASNDYNLAQSLVTDLDFVLHVCPALIPDDQKGKIISLCDQLKKAIADSNLEVVRELSADATREFEQLPELVKFVSLCADAISQARSIDPLQANVMRNKLDQMCNAIERGNTHQAEQILQDLLPDVRQYLDRDLPAKAIAIGIK